MPAWLSSVHELLARRAAPVRFFFRDDDAGWDDASLFRLTDVFAGNECPLDLAVIPESLHGRLADELLRRRDATGGLLGLHQHGWSHRNHEAAGRKCEFGASRSASEQAADIAAGARALREAFGDAIDPIFTPPWNRCSQDTADQLVDQGFRSLSRDRTAAALRTGPLVELPVAVDWTGAWNRGGGERGVVDAIIVAAAGDEPVGIMLHHATMDAVQMRRVDELLTLLRCHRSAIKLSMGELVGLRDDVARYGAAVS